MCCLPIKKISYSYCKVVVFFFFPLFKYPPCEPRNSIKFPGQQKKSECYWRSSTTTMGLKETYGNPLTLSRGNGWPTLPRVHSTLLDFQNNQRSAVIPVTLTLTYPRVALLNGSYSELHLLIRTVSLFCFALFSDSVSRVLTLFEQENCQLV